MKVTRSMKSRLPSLLLGLLLATTAAADAGVGQPADAGIAKPGDAGIAQTVDAGATPVLYVLGSSVNLRREPSAQAEVVEKLPIGTACTTSAPPGGEWLAVDCGGKTGFVSASLLGPQKPSVEQHRAEAQDTQRPLAQRLESALRAATLAPEDVALRKLLEELFFERQLKYAAADKPTAPIRTFSRMCHQETDDTCLRGFASYLVKELRLSSKTRDGLFVLVVGVPERMIIYRGRYQFPQERKDTKGYRFKGQLLAEESITPPPVLEEALFGQSSAGGRYGDHDPDARPFGQYILDEPSQALLRSIPQQWARLEVVPNMASFSKAFKKGPSFDMWWDCYEEQSVRMEFKMDIHGRWRLGIPDEGAFWITAVEKVEGGLQLSLVMNEEAWVEDIQRYRVNTVTRQALFKLPPENGDVAYLGDVPYSSKLSGYPTKPHRNCN